VIVPPNRARARARYRALIVCGEKRSPGQNRRGRKAITASCDPRPGIDNEHEHDGENQGGSSRSKRSIRRVSVLPVIVLRIVLVLLLVVVIEL
jgi:hypothetical protein